MAISHNFMHFYKTTQLTHTITQSKSLSLLAICLIVYIHTKRAFFPPNMPTASAYGRLASHCLQEGVKLYPLTSGTVSLYFGFKAEIALQ